MEQLNVLNLAGIETKTPTPSRFRALAVFDRPETRAARLTMAVIAFVLSVAFFWLVLQYWAPAHPGVDQSGYLMGGKQLAATGSTGLKPDHPLGFVSSMYVRNDATGYNYPKYPVGLPLLYAIALWTCGDLGPKAAHLVSPIGMALAVLGTYFLARRFAGTFASLAGMLILATSPVVLLLADNPNSHAACMAFCVWGAFFLVRFWETASLWRGLLGGFLLGFAVTIRYPEGVFGAMVGLVVLATLPWHLAFLGRRGRRAELELAPVADDRRQFLLTAQKVGLAAVFLLLVLANILKLADAVPTVRSVLAVMIAVGLVVLPIPMLWRGGWRSLTPAFGWAIPVVALVVFNRIAMGTWTGYDTTNESVPGRAFTIENFYDNWELFARKVHDTGLFFALPLGVLGMVLAMRTSLRRGLLLWCWLVPGAAVYLAYYWAPENGLSYLRFLITLLPPLAVGAAITLDTAMASAVGTLSRIITPIAVGAVVLGASSMGLYRGLLRLDIDDRSPISMESQFRQELNLAALSDMVIQNAPKGSVLIAPSSQLHALQFLGDYECFDPEVFRGAYATRLAGEAERNENNPDDPNPIQPQRRNFLLSHIRGKNDDQLAIVQTEIVKKAIADGRKVFVLTTNYNEAQVLFKRYGTKKAPVDGIESFISNRYSELTRPKPEDNPTPPPNDARNGRRGPNGGGPNAGQPGGRPNRMFRAGQRQQNNANWVDNLPVQKWLLVEIRKHVVTEEEKIAAAKVQERIATVAAAREKAAVAAREKAAAATRPATKPATTKPAAAKTAATRPAATQAATRPSPPPSTRPVSTRPATTRTATTQTAHLAPSPFLLDGRGLE